MRIGALISLLVLLGGCESEKSFNERYDETAVAIENQANSIDGELENSSDQDGLDGDLSDEPSNNRK